MKAPDSAQGSLFDAAPALFLDRFEELRMELSDQQLIAEAIETNHAGVRKDRTLDRYRDHLIQVGLLFRCEGVVLPTRVALRFNQILDDERVGLA